MPSSPPGRYQAQPPLSSASAEQTLPPPPGPVSAKQTAPPLSRYQVQPPVQTPPPPPGPVCASEPVQRPSAPPKQAPRLAPAERAQNSYRQLSLAAVDLNSASDELGQVIGVLDAALKKLNLGISAWVEISGNDALSDGGTHWWSREIGYGKIGEKWGVALRTRSGHYDHPDDDSEQYWLFNEAPRWMRIEAVGRIPDVLDQLVKQTEETTKTLKTKTAQAYELAQAIYDLSEEPASGEQK